MSRLLAICLLLWGTALAQVAETSAFSLKDDLNAFKELQQSKLESQKELQIKDIEAVRQQINAVDKRVDDQLAQLGQSVDRFGVVAALLSAGITVLLVLVGFLGYRNAKSEAKEAASEVARTSAQEWFEKQADQLREKIKAIEQKADQLLKEMDEHANGVKARAADVEKALNTAQESIGKTGAQTTSALADSTKVLAQRDRELKASNEDSYSFDDWNTRAHAAYATEALEDAAYFWLKAARVASAGAVSVAKVLNNRGITQGQLSQHEAAIATYDEVLRRFGEDAEPALREQVAMAMVNKGAAQGQLNQREAAIATYDEVLRRFGEAAEPALREQVAMALFNKGIIQGRLNQREAAIAAYDEVLRRFGEAAEPALREQVADALVNKGIMQGQLDRKSTRLNSSHPVLSRMPSSA